ncbi:MAG: cytochrome C [Balneolaceae bacterium]|nr:MAG: cytochrome C [Balneolaceae bacterium]
MNRFFRYILYLLSIFVGLITILVGYVKFMLPNTGPAPDIQVEITEAKVDRGRYLANHVMLCMDCHAVRDFSLFSGPPIPETLGAGGEVFDQEMGLPGSFVSRNITPAELGDWTDGEIFRAITSGVSKDGSALFPLMPYPHYSQLDEEDIYAVIAYLRSLDPVENELPASKADFPVNILINTLPAKPNFQQRPDKNDVINYGRYLITAAACTDCHTRMERGEFVGEPYAGGNEYLMPDGSIVRSANLTPHETGIGSWTKEQFIVRFKAYSDAYFVPHTVQPGQFQTIMPWTMYAGMEEEDLGAIFEYLRTLPPVDNYVELFTPAR